MSSSSENSSSSSSSSDEEKSYRSSSSNHQNNTDFSDDSARKKQRTKMYKKNTVNLSDSSSSNDDSSDSDFEAVPQKKVHKSFKSSWNHASNIKKKVYTRNSYKASIRATASTKTSTRRRVTRSYEESNDSFSSEDESEQTRAVRSSRRSGKDKKICYAENESSHTDTDDILDAEEDYTMQEEEYKDKIEIVLDKRHWSKGETGIMTTPYNERLHGGKNKDFNNCRDRENEEVHYFIKWQDKSHIHNTWESDESLALLNCAGMKKLENFKKKRNQFDISMFRASEEDREYFLCNLEMERNTYKSYRNVERIFGRSSTKNSNGRYDYRVKWQGLPYVNSTYEDESLLQDFLPLIEQFSERQRNEKVVKNRDTHKALRYRPKFEEMKEQPYWLKNKLELRNYQLEGVNWLSQSWCKNNSVILADEMGLGKTIQTISFLSYLHQVHNLYGLFLVVVPLSTMTAWQTEFDRWAPFMNVIAYQGDQQSRTIIRESEWKHPNGSYKFNAVLVQYEIVLKDKAFFGSHAWSVIAVDEAHRLKNDVSQLYRCLKDFKSNHRILITGTPMQNSMKELWALLHFIMPLKFNSWEEFEYKYVGKNETGFQSLHKVLQPFLLRRVKKDVEKSLPNKTEQILRVPMQSKQKQFYKWILTRNYEQLRKGQRGKGAVSSLNNIVMELKKCCNHAHLVREPDYSEFATAEVRLQEILKSSGKMILLDKLLKRFKEGGHRVLIFSQMVTMLNIIGDYLKMKRIKFQRLDGTTPSADRKRSLDHFNAEGSEDFCFLLSTRAGGLGINLATADTVIIFDSDWNPMNDLQAQARAHRIGQKNEVRIFRLVIADSVEENIVERAKQKMVLDHLVIQRMNTSGKNTLGNSSKKHNNPFNKEELNAILQFGAEELFAENENDDKEPECDLDDILSRAETRQEQNGAHNAYEELMQGFKVATLNLEDDEVKDWNNIIPEKDRQKFEEEERLKKEQEMFLAPRKRKKLTNGAGDQIDSDVIQSEDSQSSYDEFENDDASNKKSGRRKRLKEWDDYVQGFDEKQVRRFVKSYRKFGDPLNRLDAIARDAELLDCDSKSENNLKRLAQELHNRLHSQACNETEDESKGRGRGPSFRLAGVSVSVKATLSSIDSLAPLVKAIPKDPEARKTFSLDVGVRPVTRWHCEWNIEDDSNLMKGVYEYGMGSWDQIQADPSLGLSNKILQPNNEKPQAKQLQSRCDTILKILSKSHKYSSVADSVSTSKVKNKSRKSKEAKHMTVPSPNKRNKKKSKKFITKAIVNDDNSDIEKMQVQSKESSKSKKNKRKRQDSDQNIKENVADQDGVEHSSAKKRKTMDSTSIKIKTKVRSSDSTSLKEITKPPIKLKIKQTNPNAKYIGDSVPPLMDLFKNDEVVEKCRHILKPVKKELKEFIKLDKAGRDEADEEKEKKREGSMRKRLHKIGDLIVNYTKQYKHDQAKMDDSRTKLWNFLSCFTDKSADQWLKLYKESRNNNFNLEVNQKDTKTVKLEKKVENSRKKSGDKSDFSTDKKSTKEKAKQAVTTTPQVKDQTNSRPPYQQDRDNRFNQNSAVRKPPLHQDYNHPESYQRRGPGDQYNRGYHDKRYHGSRQPYNQRSPSKFSGPGRNNNRYGYYDRPPPHHSYQEDYRGGSSGDYQRQQSWQDPRYHGQPGGYDRHNHKNHGYHESRQHYHRHDKKL